MKILEVPVVRASPALYPKTTFFWPVVMESPARSPIEVFLFPSSKDILLPLMNREPVNWWMSSNVLPNFCEPLE